MANLYGVANAPGLVGFINPLNGTLACPAGVTTAIATTPNLVAPSQGYFYCLIIAGLVITAGATVPTGLNFSAAIGAGSYTNSNGYVTNFMAASSTTFSTYFTTTAVSQVAWQGAGSTVNIGFNPAGQAVTLQSYGSIMYVLLRAPDQ